MASSMVLRSYESKKSAAVAAIAVSMAKKHNDPMYDQLKRHRHAWKAAKDQIVQRYAGQATMQWQQSQNR